MVRKYLAYLQLTIITNLYLTLKKKFDFLNIYFVEQCTSLINNSKLQSALIVHTKSLLESFHFSADHVGGDQHTYLKLCGYYIGKLLEIIFKTCLKEGIFPDEWKKAKVVRIHKKMTKKYYLIINLFPSFQFVVRYFNVLCSYNAMYKHISDNNFCSPNQSGFRTGDS